MTVINRQHIERFKYIYDITDYIKHPNSTLVDAGRYFELEEWLDSSIGKYSYILGYYNADGVNGYWAICLNNEEDFTLFKLRFKQYDPCIF